MLNMRFWYVVIDIYAFDRHLLMELFHIKWTSILQTTNFQAQIDAQESTIKPPNSTAQDMDWNHYFHLQTIHAWLDDLAIKYKNIVTIIDVGKSYEGLPLKGIKLSHRTNNTAVFIEGGIHAREWISPATTTFILNQLLTSNDTQIQYIAQNWDWFFFPVINPDGYRNTFEEDRMWRKTRQPVGLCRGTDLNRNWNVHWNGKFHSFFFCPFFDLISCREL